MSGNTNRLYDYLEKYLSSLITDLKAEDWNTMLGFQRPKHHGGQFKGGQCSKLLISVDVLEQQISSARLLEDVYSKTLTTCFKCFQMVKVKCLGMVLEPSFKESIEESRSAYLALGETVSPKVYGLIVHNPEFLDSMQTKYPGKGLGFWSDQASESVHYSFKGFWEKGNTTSSVNKDYPRKVLKVLESLIVYNSRHTHFKN